ncbi:transcription factor bHLH90 [Durio zibethinus]|uniref:Transcription factor bHLH90 n=1 Tax=Durio zibethinus TaxID=66656 RepID=A0A6P5Y5B2_DURZI|nr:transcription factor bHLH90 [Durio zibethinus]
MRGFERAVEWLRPFVDSKTWDFCVVWKLGDDPSRFIEWKDCCCSGGIHVKVEKDESQQHLGPLCRDAHFQHSIRSKACEALSHFPFVMSLYAGSHGEVAMSNQPNWVNHANASGSDSSHETMGTQVLIPVFGGLIELFASKHIPKDQNIIELVTTQCNALLKPEVTTAESYTKENLDKWYHNALLEKDLHNLPFSISLSTFIPRIQSIPLASDSNSHPSLDGSSRGPSPSVEHPPFASGSACSSQDEQLKQLIGTYNGTKRLRCSKNVSEQQAVFVLDHKTNSVNDKIRTTKKPEKENYHSKNLVTERNRRKKIKDGLFKLRALVPKISKMDRTAILTDAIEYIGDLQEEKKKLQNELTKIEEEDCEKSNLELKSAKLDKLHKDMSAVKQNQVSSGLADMEKMEVHVEVNQITKREFLIKLYYEHKRGGFAKLMEGIDSLGLRVIDANVTTFNGKVLNIFKVEELVMSDFPLGLIFSANTVSVTLMLGKQGFSFQEIERLVDRPTELDKSDSCFHIQYRKCRLRVRQCTVKWTARLRDKKPFHSCNFTSSCSINHDSELLAVKI